MSIRPAGTPSPKFRIGGMCEVTSVVCWHRGPNDNRLECRYIRPYVWALLDETAQRLSAAVPQSDSPAVLNKMIDKHV